MSSLNRPLISVFGDIMLDRYWLGSVKRISPEAPIPIINIHQKEDKLGGAANVALNLSALEKSVALCGFIGNDHEGQLIQTLCKKDCINDQLIVVNDFPSITKLRIIGRQQQLVRCDFEDIKDLSKESIHHQSKFLELIDQSSIIILSDYQKGFLSNPQLFIQYAKQKDIPVIIDPKGDNFDKYRGATLLTPNRSEFEAIVGNCITEEIFLERAEQLRNTLDIEALLITRSEEGMTLIQKGHSPFSIPAKTQDVYDVTGAGDTVIATIAAKLSEGKSLQDSVIISNTAAAIVVGKLGASQVSAIELEHALSEQERAHHLVLSPEALLKEVKLAKMKGEVVVMTNGCFDLLHKGHVTYLNEARKLGDRLIVALNSDASIKQLKGETRPIMDESSRATVLASLSAVDWVVIFNEETPEHLIKQILPDILVKGSDYSVDQIAGAQAVIDNGGEVKLLNFVEGYSTTQAIKKIKEQ